MILVSLTTNCMFQIVYSTLYEVIVEFTRDYELIRNALNKLEHYDKTNVENLLLSVNNLFLSTWGNQNYCQLLVVSDCGVGFGKTSINNLIERIMEQKEKIETDGSKVIAATEAVWSGFPYPSKLSFICMGNTSDPAFVHGT